MGLWVSKIGEFEQTANFRGRFLWKYLHGIRLFDSHGELRPRSPASVPASASGDTDERARRYR